MGIELAWLHWAFLFFILLILATMIMRRDSTLVCVIGILFLGYLAKGSVNQAVVGVFNSFIYAINELSGTILVISLIVSMSKVMLDTGVNEVMVAPLVRVIHSPGVAYWIIGIFMMLISWFFWPSPAVALMGAVLMPVGRRVGLPAIGVAMAMNLFGHGIALSGDWVIQGAPKLTADAAGIPVQAVINASVPLVVVMGLVTVTIAYWLLKRDLDRGVITTDNDNPIPDNPQDGHGADLVVGISPFVKNCFAIMVPIFFISDVIAMFIFGLRGGDATALIGGTAIGILILMSMYVYKSSGMEQITVYIIEGFKFGFGVFAPVIPIAAFFYLGDSGFVSIFGKVLPAGSQGLVNDLGLALANTVPITTPFAAFTITVVGCITGLDGSGFSGISLVGSLAKLFSISIGSGIDTLTALGQIGAIFTGGGTLIPWSLIAVAAICNVSPFELARRNLVPVMIGLLVTTVVAVFLI